MNFNNVSLLSISEQQNSFGGDLSFHKIKNISITGYLLDLQNTDGVKSIIEQANDIFEIPDALASDDSSILNTIQDIEINGVDYGKGFVTSFSVDGDSIQTANYEAELVVKEEGDLKDIILAQNLYPETATGTSTPLDNKLIFSDSNLTDEDLKYLENFDENLSFTTDASNKGSFTHQINCTFKHRESLIPSRKNIWSNSSIQQSKLKNLKNRGKGSLKVLANQVSSYSLSLNAGDYVLQFDYLGQDSQSWGSASVDFENENYSLDDVAGIKKIEVNLTTSKTVSISLNANSTNNTFFDNLKLFKKDELPLQKSRELANFLLDNNPNYPVIQSSYNDKYKNSSSFDNFSYTESFDEVNLTYSKSRTIENDALQNGSDISLSQNYAVNYLPEGVIEITEVSNLQLLKNKTNNNLKNFATSVVNGSYSRCLSKLEGYEDYFTYGCPTNTSTEINKNNLLSTPISKSITYNINKGLATIQVVYSNNNSLKFNGGPYNHEHQESISEFDGYYIINISGVIQGEDEALENKNAYAKNGLDDAISGLATRISEIKTNIGISSTFRELSRTIDANTAIGEISYDIEYSDKKSLEGYTDADGKKIAKSYEISVAIDNSSRIYNNFSVNCKNIAQLLGNLFSPKTITVSIDLNGYKNVTQIELYNAAKSILTSQNLLFDDENSNNFLTEENYNFSEKQKSLSYTRASFDLSSCPVPTITATEGFGFLNDFKHPPFTPTPETITFEPETFDIYPITSTSTPEFNFNYTPYEPTIIPEETPTTTQTETFTPFTQTNFPTATETENVGQPDPTSTPTLNSYFYRAYIPDNWNNNIANLAPGGNIILGYKCLDEGGSLSNPNFTFINQSYAEDSSNIVKDCYRGIGDNGQAFGSFLFEMPPEITPTPLVDQCTLYTATIPDFWVGTIGDLVSSSTSFNIIGGYKNSAAFLYSNLSSSSDLIKLSDNNSSHPDFNSSSKEVYAGPLIIESCQPISVESYDVVELNIPLSSSKSIKELVIENQNDLNWSVGICFEIIGYRSCNNVKRYNSFVNQPPTTTETPRELQSFSVVDNCNELSGRTQVFSVYLRKYSCGSTSIENSIG